MRSSSLLKALAAVLSLLALTGAPTSAATFSVTTFSDAGPGSLRQALLNANFSPGVDTIDIALPAGGTIALQSPLPQISDGVTIQGPGRDLLAIDAQHTGPVLVVALSGDIRILDLTLTGGLADSGGGMLISGARLAELERVTIRNNRARARGGAIAIANPSIQLALLDSIVSDNRADTGGGLSNSECSNVIRIERTLFSENVAEAQGGGYGGGLTGCADLDILDSAFVGNRATVRGGAIDLNLAQSPQIRLRNTTLSDNRGGGLAISHRGGPASPVVTLEHTTIAGNLQTSDPNPTFIEDYGFRLLFSSELTLTIRNSIIADNERGDCNTDLAAAGSHRLDSDGSCGFDEANDLPSTTPLLAAIADNGGPTSTRALLAGSPAIDAGDDGNCLPTDQRGILRPQDGDGDGIAHCDLGAFEREAATTECVTAPDTLCLNNDRFEVTALWEDIVGTQGVGMARRLTTDTGYFWFFTETNVEVVIKVLEACAISDRYWVFAAGLTNVDVTLRLRDTLAGVQRTYTNAQGTPFQPIQDTDAFATCP